MKNNAAARSSKYYVYCLYEENSDDPFYVGKGTYGSSSRPRTHLREARSGCECAKCVTIREIWADGLQVEGWVVFESENENDVLAEECRLIAEIGRENLTNRSNGGEGRSNPRSYQAYLQDRKARRQAFINERGPLQPRLWGSVFDQIEAKYAWRDS